MPALLDWLNKHVLEDRLGVSHIRLWFAPWLGLSGSNQATRLLMTIGT